MRSNTKLFHRNHFWIFVSTIIFIFFTISNTYAGSVELSPPYTDAVVTHVASDTSWILGDAGYYSTVDTDTGRIIQNGIAYAAILGGAGVLVGDAMCGEFTVPVSGEYTIELSGSISRLLHSVGKTAIAGSQKGVFKIEIMGGVQGRALVKDVIYETDLSPSAYLGEITSSTVSNLLDAAPVSGVLKTGIDVYDAVNEIQDAFPDVPVDHQFSISVTVTLNAGTHWWWFDQRSTTIATALGLSAMYASSTVDCVLESITITSSVDNYKITASSGSHGSIDPDGDVYVAEGNSVTFNATPDLGYVVDRWYVDGQDVGGNISSILIQNVQADRTVFVTFKLQSGSGSETVTLTSDDDTIISEYSNTSNFGSLDSMGLAGIVGHRSYSLVKFNLNNIPSGSTVNSVELKLYSRGYYNPDNVDTWICTLGQSWSESTATWSNQPLPVGDFSVWKNFTGLGYHIWSSTSYSGLKTLAQGWVDGTKEKAESNPKRNTWIV